MNGEEGIIDELILRRGEGLTVKDFRINHRSQLQSNVRIPVEHFCSIKPRFDVLSKDIEIIVQNLSVKPIEMEIVVRTIIVKNGIPRWVL